MYYTSLIHIYIIYICVHKCLYFIHCVKEKRRKQNFCVNFLRIVSLTKFKRERRKRKKKKEFLYYNIDCDKTLKLQEKRIFVIII